MNDNMRPNFWKFLPPLLLLSTILSVTLGFCFPGVGVVPFLTCGSLISLFWFLLMWLHSQSEYSRSLAVTGRIFGLLLNFIALCIMGRMYFPPAWFTDTLNKQYGIAALFVFIGLAILVLIMIVVTLVSGWIIGAVFGDLFNREWKRCYGGGEELSDSTHSCDVISAMPVLPVNCSSEVLSNVNYDKYRLLIFFGWALFGAVIGMLSFSSIIIFGGSIGAIVGLLAAYAWYHFMLIKARSEAPVDLSQAGAELGMWTGLIAAIGLLVGVMILDLNSAKKVIFLNGSRPFGIIAYVLPGLFAAMMAGNTVGGSLGEFFNDLRNRAISGLRKVLKPDCDRPDYRPVYWRVLTFSTFAGIGCGSPLGIMGAIVGGMASFVTAMTWCGSMGVLATRPAARLEQSGERLGKLMGLSAVLMTVAGHTVYVYATMPKEAASSSSMVSYTILFQLIYGIMLGIFIGRKIGGLHGQDLSRLYGQSYQSIPEEHPVVEA